MKFRIGDRVICNDGFALNHHGTIVCIEAKDSLEEVSYGVDMDEPFVGHGLNGKLGTPTGRWYTDVCIRLETPPEWDDENNE